jgi:hypothetical protein
LQRRAAKQSAHEQMSVMNVEEEEHDIEENDMIDDRFFFSDEDLLEDELEDGDDDIYEDSSEIKIIRQLVI